MSSGVTVTLRVPFALETTLKGTTGRATEKDCDGVLGTETAFSVAFTT